MKKTLLLKFFIVCMLSQVLAQKQARYWYFGGQAGLRFDSTAAPVTLTNSVMTNEEGVASISDKNGNLLFYTDGMTVYNATHNIMMNGTGLLGNNSSTQSAIIVEKPKSDSLYYIFTVDFLGNSNGLNYSIVDMSLNAGNGAISSKNNLMLSNAREKVTAIRHANKKDYWILVIDWLTDDIHSYLLDSSGIHLTPVISPMDSLQMQIVTASLNRANGYMKANRQGTKLAMALWNSNSYDLFDFNNSTGVVSNHQKIQGTATTFVRTYGVEFSPDGTKLYGTTGSNIGTNKFSLMQFDLNAGSITDILNSRYVIKDSSYSAHNYYFSAIQIGPDGKIYCSLDGEHFLGVINKPNLLGAACNYVHNGVSLGTKIAHLGLPNFISDEVLSNGQTAIIDINEPLNINIYPNPTNGIVNILLNETPNEPTSFVLEDLSGRKIDEATILSKETAIELKVNSGMYIATIISGNRSYSKKIFINK